MGKRIIVQRRGRGTSRYRAKSHRYKAEIKYRVLDETEKSGAIQGIIKEFIHCPGHSAPLAIIQYKNGDITVLPAPLGVEVNKIIASGFSASVEIGNTIPLKNIPEGTSIYNIESKPGDGGKFIRASGSSAKIVAKTNDKVTIRFPSKKLRDFNPSCRATVGILAGAGRLEKPFVKAGKKHHAMKARNKLYPRTSGVAMNAVDHPFGSGRGRHVGKPKTPNKNAPPGRKVGLLRARRTGRRR